jgi:hypothetical protein
MITVVNPNLIMKTRKYTTLPRISPACKYVGWIVDYCNGSTSNPLPKIDALKKIAVREKTRQKSKLIKCWLAVEAKKLKPSHHIYKIAKDYEINEFNVVGVPTPEQHNTIKKMVRGYQRLY